MGWERGSRFRAAGQGWEDLVRRKRNLRITEEEQKNWNWISRKQENPASRRGWQMEPGRVESAPPNFVGRLASIGGQNDPFSSDT